MNEISGTFVGTVWHSPDTDFQIGKIKLETGELLTVLGDAEEGKLISGIPYRFSGKMEFSQKFNADQFKFKHFVQLEPVSRRGVVKYLEKHANGIGPAIAARLWDEFGKDAIKQLRINPAIASAHVRGLNLAVAERAAEALQKIAEFEETNAELLSLLGGRGFQSAVYEELIKLFGVEAPAVIKRDPFTMLVRRIKSASFNRCDQLYQDHGGDLRRLKRQMLWLWDQLDKSTSGSTWHDQKAMCGMMQSTISGGGDGERAIKLGLRANWLARYVDKEGRVWITSWDRANDERYIAERITELCQYDGDIRWPDASEVENVTDHQREELAEATAWHVGVLSGSPGTGKSWATASMLTAMAQQNLGPVAVVAPTGKAAVRLTEYMGQRGLSYQAMTIHRLLGPEEAGHGGERWKFSANEKRPLPHRFFVVDECFPAGTMIDAPGGKKDIRDIVSGDKVFSAWGVDMVVATQKREVLRVAKITIGGKEIISSAGHPFFTKRGWVVAEELRPGDSLVETEEAMRLLQQGVCSDWQEQQDWSKPFLFSILFNELVADKRVVSQQNLHRREESEVWRSKGEFSSVREQRGNVANRKDPQLEPDKEVVGKKKDQQAAARDWTQADIPRRQRTGSNQMAGCIIQVATERVGDGSGSFIRKKEEGLSNELQAGYSGAFFEDRNRDRRELPLLHNPKKEGQEKRESIKPKRVDHIEVLEQGNPELDRFRDEHGRLCFYDLMLERHPSYSVNGFLVHNCSMVGVPIMADFLRAVPKGSHILFVGDIGQLPPVDHGCPMRDIIAAGIPTGELTKIERNDGEGVRLCHDIKAGKRLEISGDVDLENGQNVILSEQASPTVIRQLILKTLQFAPQGINPIWDVQLIAPLNEKGPLSSLEMSKFLQPVLNPPAADEMGCKVANDVILREGDKVMCTENTKLPLWDLVKQEPVIDEDSDDGEEKKDFVANGEIGRVARIWEETFKDKDGQQKRRKWMAIDLPAPSRCVRVCGDGIFKWRLAYCITCHKCVSPDTIVETPDGLMPIRKLPHEKGMIATHLGQAFYQEKFEYKKANCIQVEFSDGSMITVTENHGCETFYLGKWKRTAGKELTPGQWCRFKLGKTFDPKREVFLHEKPSVDSREKEWAPPVTCTLETSELLGLLVADGVLFKSGVRVGKRHKEVAERFSELCQSVFGVQCNVFRSKHAEMWIAELCSTGIATWLSELGGLNPHMKYVPECVLLSSSDHHKRFLKGLFEDGSIHGKGETIDHIHLYTKFRKVETTVRLMLRRLGIKSRTNSQVKQKGNIYLYGQDASRFCRKIGFISGPKAQKSNTLKDRPFEPKYKVPFHSELLGAWKEFEPKSNAANAMRSAEKQGMTTRATISKYLLSKDHPELWEKASGILLWDYVQIKSINRVQSAAMCVEVPQDERFLQNGLPWFNSQGSQAPYIIYLNDDSRPARRVSSKQLIYTALSRFEHAVFVFGKLSTMQSDCLVDALAGRKTFLRELLKDAEGLHRASVCAADRYSRANPL